MKSIEEIEILIVEDNAMDAELALRALKEKKLTNNIHIALDGEEALEFIFATGRYTSRKNSKLPKVILLDLKLPKVDGLEVLQELKKNSETQHIPVVILTSSSQESDVIKSYKLGANSYIIKPVDFDKFMQSVGELGLYWLLLNKPPVE